MELTGNNTEHLRQVFDMFDTGKQGYITVQHFEALAKDYFGTVDSGQEVS